MKNKFLITLTCLALFASCENETIKDDTSAAVNQENAFALKFNVPNKHLLDDVVNNIDSSTLKAEDSGEYVVASQQLSEINALLASQNIAIASMHVMNTASSVTIVDSQFELTLEQHWVPNDPRNGGDLVIEYNSFPFFNLANGSNGSIPTDEISDNAFRMWEEEGSCDNSSGPSIERVENNGVWNSTLLTLQGELGTAVSDINIVGHVPGFIFDLFDGLSSTGTIGVAFSFIHIETKPARRGRPERVVATDIDNDGFNDTAGVEIFYNNNFRWTTDTTAEPRSVDLATIITHEQGHSLGLGHFGIAIETTNEDGSSSVKTSPLAVMNALYTGGSNSEIQGSDAIGFCINYRDWFNN